jgi:hypothetical protein
MQRRKILAALGSLAAGGAATVGTGAVTSVTADRTATVNVAGDGSAYLKLVPGDDTGSPTSPSGPNAAYAEYNGDDELELNLDGNASGGFSGTQGDGVNPNAVTDIDEVFYIANQGTQEVYVYIEDSGNHDGDVTFYAHNKRPDQGGTNKAPDGSGGGGTASGSSIEPDESGAAVPVGPGSSLEVSMEVDSTDVSGTPQMLDSITVHANVNQP